jgi:hypothetical protein
MGHSIFRIEAHDEIGRSKYEGDCSYSVEEDAVALLDVGKTGHNQTRGMQA